MGSNVPLSNVVVSISLDLSHVETIHQLTMQGKVEDTRITNAFDQPYQNCIPRELQYGKNGDIMKLVL